ncbi:hypothetical protein F0562_026229 [Nyssa sinensis]|uniref:Uncharacterized protein n=1 Tax=Nyssa sinensis TaxID=561372 RepID=A0A5J5BCU1_9ASTE|nr:hypothetical protein F0562_026229 [Nyssa sinensis]
MACKAVHNDKGLRFPPSSWFAGQLHHVGVPFSRTIAPVTYMWRPIRQSMGVDAEDHNNDEYDEPQRVDSCSSLR